ncbi:MAG: DUF445 domain-containing protein [Chitinophagaceae bacterium]|nr:DUF445 domain-containing protein [Chitinophagaceae bacterium]
MNYWLLLIPVLSALIGFAGSRAAGIILVQKIIPGRREELAGMIGSKVAENFSLAGIEKKISGPENIKKVMPVVEAHVDDFLRHKLKAKMPMIGMLIGDKTINSLKEVFLKEIEEMFPQVMGQFAGNLKNEINIEELVAAKIRSVSPATIKDSLSPVIRYFCLAGAIIGFVAGLVNTGLFLLL